MHPIDSRDFTGDAGALVRGLAPVTDDISLHEADARGRMRVSLHVAPGASLRDVIDIANRSVIITSVRESLASMNDIFIRNVQSDRTCQKQAL